MPVKVSMGKPTLVGNLAVLAFGQFRVSETIAVGATTTIVAQAGEIAVLLSTEASAVNAAHGPVPDAAATTATSATSAGYGLPPGTPYPVALQAGDKISVKVFG
jgi:hypothetical protein